MTDFPTMKGDARMARGASAFSVPIFSHVIDGLWQGCSPSEFPDVEEEGKGLWYYAHNFGKPASCKWLYADKEDPTNIDEPRFDKILNLYPWGKYVVPEGTEMVEVEAYDGSEVDIYTFKSAALKVVEWLNENYTVLVHCQAGLNRSSFVVALVLMSGLYGMTPDDAITKIRQSRSPLCLCNESFVEYLQGLA